MHSRGLFRKWLGEAEASTEAHSDLSDPANCAEGGGFILARIFETAAVAAGERPATAVQKRNTAAAVLATVVCITAKPGTTPAKGA
jgi:hypothetical protein